MIDHRPTTALSDAFSGGARLESDRRPTAPSSRGGGHSTAETLTTATSAKALGGTHPRREHETMTDDTDRVACGTYAGWNQHNRKHEPQCNDCLAAAAHYMRDNRRTNGTRCATQFPITTPRHDVTKLPGLGSVIARGLRENA